MKGTDTPPTRPVCISAPVCVIGQIAYKKGCLKIVIEHLNHWHNKALVAEALEEIIGVHHRYRNFSAMTQNEARQYIAGNYLPHKMDNNGAGVTPHG